MPGSRHGARLSNLPKPDLDQLTDQVLDDTLTAGSFDTGLGIFATDTGLEDLEDDDLEGKSDADFFRLDALSEDDNVDGVEDDNVIPSGTPVPPGTEAPDTTISALQVDQVEVDNAMAAISDAMAGYGMVPGRTISGLEQLIANTIAVFAEKPAVMTDDREKLWEQLVDMMDTSQKTKNDIGLTEGKKVSTHMIRILDTMDMTEHGAVTICQMALAKDSRVFKMIDDVEEMCRSDEYRAKPVSKQSILTFGALRRLRQVAGGSRKRKKCE